MLIDTSSHRPGIILDGKSELRGRRNSRAEKQLPAEYRTWIGDMRAICTDLSTRTHTTVMQWDGFKGECTQFFPANPLFPPNTSIGQTFNRIRVLEYRLEALIKELDQDQYTVNFPLQRILSKTDDTG